MRWIALIGVSLLAFTAFLDVTIVNTAIPFINAVFPSSVLQLQWVINIYAMVLTMTMVAVGRFADIHGRKKVFYTGVTIFGIAALFAGFSPSIEVLICFRGLQGLGASVLFVSSAALIADTFPKKEQVHAISIYTGINGLGLASGPLLGGLLIEWLNWRWVFWINLPLIAVGLVACLMSLRVPSQKRSEMKIDWRGLILLIVGLGSFIHGIIDAADYGFEAPITYLSLGAGVVLLTLFAYSERRSRAPLLDLSIFKHKLLLLSLLSCSLAGFAAFVFMFFDPLYLRLERKLSALSIGLLIATIPAAQVLISAFFQPLVKTLGIRKLMVVSIFSAFLAIIAHGGITATSPLGLLIIPFALLGVNWGLSNAGTIAAVNETMSPGKIGIALGSIFTIWNMVGSVFLATSSALFHVKEQASSFMPAFHVMVLFNAVFALAVVLTTVSLIKKES